MDFFIVVDIAIAVLVHRLAEIFNLLLNFVRLSFKQLLDLPVSKRQRHFFTGNGLPTIRRGLAFRLPKIIDNRL